MMSASKWKPYSESKQIDYKWLESIPKDWDLCRLKHYTYMKGRIGWHGLKSGDFIDEGPFLVTGSDIVNGKVDWNNCYHVNIEKYDMDPYIQLQEGDLLITKDGTIGKLAIVRDMPGLATLNSGIFVLRPKRGKYDSEYMYYLLQSDLFHGFNDYNKYGSTIDHLYQHTFGNMPFTAPTLDEQEKIVKFLRNSLASIDKTLETAKRSLDTLEESRSALIKQAVTKGLNPNLPMKDSGIDWIGEVPEHWELKRTDWFLCVKKNQVLASDLGEEVFHYSIPSIRDNGDGKIEPSVDIESSKFQIDQPLLLVSKLNPRKGMVLIGKEREMPTICSSEFVPMLAEDCSLDWAYYLFSSDSTRQRLASVVQSATRSHQRARPEHVTSMWHAVPPVDEQREIAAYLERNLQTVNSIDYIIQSKIEKLKEYRTALISAAVTGQIDVRHLEA